MSDAPHPSLLDRLIRFCLENRLVVGLGTAAAIVWGVLVAPFDWEIPFLPRDPVAVDAIPDIGENQQVVFTAWPGRSPKDVDDQITYPLTVSLLGTPGVKTIRSSSAFGFSSIYIIFNESVEFYWSRSRVVEKLASLPPGTLPDGVRPQLGPDATALGQIFWYTLEGRDPDGNPTGGWDLHELRSIQDWQVRYALLAATDTVGNKPIAEVASIGGFVREYQVDVDPDAMWAHGVTLDDVFRAVRMSNLDVGARTLEMNRVEYVIRGLGFLQGVGDLEEAVVKMADNVPVRIRDIATVALGPAGRRGALDKEGAEAVGGVVVVRYGENPLAAIDAVKRKIGEIASSLPTRTLPNGTVSRVTIVPFYDRTGLIHETLGTLHTALVDEVLVTILVVIVMLLHLRSAGLVSGLLPLAILMCFIGMKVFGVDANIVALSGIAIAIGTMVDMGIVVTENVLGHLERAEPDVSRIEAVYRGTSEVGGAVLTAILTTVVGFLPVFVMTGAEGKLFRPLAYTKTFALLASVIVALTILPAVASLILGRGGKGRFRLPGPARIGLNGFAALAVALLLARHWAPLGPERETANVLFVVLLIGFFLAAIRIFQALYEPVLRWCLAHKGLFAIPVLAIVAAGGWVWSTLGREFMPSLDEGSFLYMPTTMTHASIGEALDALQIQDRAIRAIPEVERVVGKIGRAETPLDPAPISMVETVVQYKPEYRTDRDGRRIRFRYDEDAELFVRDAEGNLVEDPDGRPFRQWRPEIRTPEDIWDAIAEAARVPGMTDAPRLQPIETRLVMLQTGMRAPMGVKVTGPDLGTIERVGLDIEAILKTVPGVRPEAVFADRIVGKPYLEIDIDRRAIARYGIHVGRVQEAIEVAIGGRPITMTVEGRERYPVRIRYQRERRDTIESLDRILVPAPDGTQIPLGQLAEIRYERGPQMIKSEDTFLLGYVLFDRKSDRAEVDVVEEARRVLAERERAFENALAEAAATAREEGRMLSQEEIDRLPGLNLRGCSYRFSGSYENQVRAAKRLAVILPLALFVIFLILYFQFRSVAMTMLIFSGVIVAAAGGFLMLGLYGTDWFLNFDVAGVSLRELFQIHEINLSVAVWVGMLALFGIATDDGVVMGTYIRQRFQGRTFDTPAAIREEVVAAGLRRVRPCLMTSATTILALLPVLTSTGRGADVMIPMAIPSFGGMTVVILSMFMVPVGYAWIEELSLARRLRRAARNGPGDGGKEPKGK